MTCWYLVLACWLLFIVVDGDCRGCGGGWYTLAKAVAQPCFFRKRSKWKSQKEIKHGPEIMDETTNRSILPTRKRYIFLISCMFLYQAPLTTTTKKSVDDCVLLDSSNNRENHLYLQLRADCIYWPPHLRRYSHKCPRNMSPWYLEDCVGWNKTNSCF